MLTTRKNPHPLNTTTSLTSTNTNTSGMSRPSVHPYQKVAVAGEQHNEEEHPVQMYDRPDASTIKPFQLKSNDTGLPDHLKSGVEKLSGYSLDDVQVHYNSDKPAQLQAYAYAQGNQIHVAPGQERHVPHEAWHVVQQKQGRVNPVFQMKGDVSINDNAALEDEADVMGSKALELTGATYAEPVEVRNSGTGVQPVQRKIHGKSDINGFLEIIMTNFTAWGYYYASPQVQNFVQDAVSNKKTYMSYPNAFDPQSMNFNTPKRHVKLDSNEAVCKWVIALYYSFFETESGFTEAPAMSKHAAVISKKDNHDKNWEKFVDERLAKIPVTVNTGIDPGYLQHYTAAQLAAVELDRKELAYSTMKINVSNELSDIQTFADYIESVRDQGQSDVKGKIPEWKTEPKYGSGIGLHAEFFPNMTLPRGSGKDIVTPIDWFYESRKSGPTARYVKGHLLNDHVGGHAKNYNLAPLREEDNHIHDNGIEAELKFAVGDMQREVVNQHPSTYRNILYDVYLDAQSSRSGTAIWAEAAAYLEACKAKEATVNDIVDQETVDTDDGLGTHDFSQAPASLLTLIDSFNLDSSVVIKNILSTFQYNRLLWEMEDYLVRPWYVRLQINRTLGETMQNLVLENKKPDELNAHFEVPKEKGTSGHKWNENTSRPGAHYDTATLHRDHPIRLERELTNMTKNDYAFYRYYLQKKSKDVLLQRLPEVPDSKAFYGLVAANATELAETLSYYRANSEKIIEDFRKERQQDTQKLTFSLLTMSEYTPKETSNILSNVSKKQITPSNMSMEFSSFMGGLSSPLRHSNITSLGDEVDKMEETRQYERGKQDGEYTGYRKKQINMSSGHSAYIRGYNIGMMTGLEAAGKNDGNYWGFDDGYKYKAYAPKSHFSVYKNDALNKVCRDAFDDAYPGAYNSGVRALGKKHGEEDREGGKRWNPWKPNDQDYVAGYDQGYSNKKQRL